jgi:hypothetical protein
MPQEPKLQMLPDKDMKLPGAHFRKVVRRIESIVPLAGEGITVTPKDGGYEISLKEEEDSTLPPLNIITFNVCSNGVPAVVEVYGPFTI